MIAALDTMSVIWGITHAVSSNKDVATMQYRAHILIDMLQQDGAQIMIPSVVVAELLTGIDPKDHGNFLATLQTTCFCPPFDVRAAALAAKLWLEHRQLPAADQLNRRTLKADTIIVATAFTSGAKRFYTNDRKCRSLAKKAGLDALDLPVSHPDMYSDLELKKQFRLA
jgi:predicted nucleic acid-binding protein